MITIIITTITIIMMIVIFVLNVRRTAARLICASSNCPYGTGGITRSQSPASTYGNTHSTAVPGFNAMPTCMPASRTCARSHKQLGSRRLSENTCRIPCKTVMSQSLAYLQTEPGSQHAPSAASGRKYENSQVPTIVTTNSRVVQTLQSRIRMSANVLQND